MLAVLFCLLLPVDPAPVLPTPNWKAGQEFLYRGTVKESGQLSSIQLMNQFQLEVRIIVLSVQHQSAEVICCTKLVQQGIPKVEQALSVHLTRALIDSRGRVSSCSAPTGLAMSTEGPATWESGFILPLPTEPVQPGGSWEITEPGRLPLRFSWEVPTDSTTHLLITGKQHSIDWDRPRADSTAWRRTDKLHFAPQATLPTRIERTIERRAPAHQHVTGRIITEYELIRKEQLAGPVLEERQRDIQQLKLFQQEVSTLAARPHDTDARQAWQRLATRLERYQQAPGSSPYREALITMLATVQAGIENRLSIQQTQFENTEPSIPIGQLTPHFTLLTSSGQTITSQQCRGKPCLLVFLQPCSELTKVLAVELPAWQQRLGTNTFGCLLLSSTDALATMPAIVEPAGRLLKVANGKPLVASYGASVTPYFVLIDADGTLLATHEGWGPEVKQELEKRMGKELGKMRR